MEGRFGSGVLWNAGVARKALRPGTRTMNPTPAAAKLLGKKRVARGKRVLAKRQGRRSAHRGNPLPAIIALASQANKLPVIGGLLNRHPEDPIRKQHIDEMFAAGNAAGLEAASRDYATQKARDYAAQKLAELNAAHATQVVQHAAASPEDHSTLASIMATPGAGRVAAEVTKALVRRPRQRRGRLLYYDSYQRPHYTSRPPGPVKLPRDATLAPEAAAAGFVKQGFFGKVGGGGAGRTAGQLAVAGAAGVGAYLVTSKLLQYLGGKAQSKEEAGVTAAKALHDALEEYKKAHGTYPPPAERAAMKQAYRAQLQQLGYDPDTFTRTRSGVESFLETYNPLGG